MEGSSPEKISSKITSPLQKRGIQFRLEECFPREVPMPVYDYLCNDCHKEFEKVLTLNEHEKEKITCPHCGSKNVEQEAKAFFAVTSKKS
jgi:putative FmdB family regulatory protein